MLPDEVSQGRVRTKILSCAIYITSRFAPGSFSTTHHLTLGNFSQQEWLSNVCSVLGPDDAFPNPAGIALLASVHDEKAASSLASIPAASTEFIA